MIYQLIPLCSSPSAIIGCKITKVEPLEGYIVTTSDNHNIITEQFSFDGKSQIITPMYHIPIQFLFNFLLINECMDEKGKILKDEININLNNNLA